MYEYAFGVDIGGTTIKIGLFDDKGRVIMKQEIPTRTEYDGEQILDDVVDMIHWVINEKKIRPRSILGIGVGVPGPINADGCVDGCVNLGWKIKDVKNELSQKTGFKVRVENDANVAGLGEQWQGAAKGYKNAVVITLGTGIGGAVIINGEIVPGAHGASGEFGHIHVNDDELEPCGCGNCGCLEQYVSASGVVRLASRIMNKNQKQTKLAQYDILTSKIIYDEAKNGDVVAHEIVEEVHRLLGKHIAMIGCVLDPEIVIIGGGMSKAGQILMDGVRNQYEKYAFKPCIFTRIKAAQLGNDAGIYGAARLLIDDSQG